MSPLERRCRLLLFGYPVGYRKSRGEEIIGTLLDATPEDRAWPLPRDVRALLIAGVRARFTLNRERTTATNLRIAVTAGVAAYLCFLSATWFHITHVAPVCAARYCAPPPGGPILVPALIATAAVLACVCRSRALILCAALPAGFLMWIDLNRGHDLVGEAEAVLPCLALLVILAGGRERPGSSWLWALAAIAISPWLNVAGAGLGGWELFAAFAVFSIAWIVVDAKLAIAVVAFFFAMWLQWALSAFWTLGGIPGPMELEAEIVLGIIAAVGALALWRLRRQSARQPRRIG
jgi:hypothetical protein